MILELELHEWLPYLFSIGWICALAGIYTLGLYTEGSMNFGSRHKDDRLVPIVPQETLPAAIVQKRLVRHVKRKESPDEDESECRASLIMRKPNQRGGYICLIDHLSLSARTENARFSFSLLF
ncbi:hypothetical protein ACFQZE_20870 [Paenibacillus sp. GCM10027627]|uniref:hypothetical protein n=1 Tax=unclassified Paenibacillus TaxID=185978 RepID=UPI00363D1598